MITLNNEGGTTDPRAIDWDVGAALSRVGGNHVDGLKERIRELAVHYRADQDHHLSFEEVQRAVDKAQPRELGTEQLAHVRNCRFCRDLIDSIAVSDRDRQTFVDLLRRFETERARNDGPEAVPLPNAGQWAPAAAAAAAPRSASRSWPIGLAAGVGAIAIIGYAVTRIPQVAQLAHLRASTEQISMASTSPAAVDWNHAAMACKEDSNQPKSCDLFVAAAALTASGKPGIARPVVVSALREAGVEDAALADIDAVLPTRAIMTDAEHRASLPNQKISGENIDAAHAPALLAAAKIEFASGNTVLGYQHVGSYVGRVLPHSGAERALQIGFIEPVRQAEATQIASAKRSVAGSTH